MNAISRKFRAWLITLPVLFFAAGAAADELRNVKIGEEAPEFSMQALDGTTINSSELKGNAVILVVLSAQQRGSEEAAAGAVSVLSDLHHDGLKLVFVTADTARADYFRKWRDRTNVHAPLGLDFERKLYGALGLIVLPTTIVIDKDWKLSHVISTHKSDYEHVLSVHAQRALGVIDDERAEKLLERGRFERDRPGDRIARHIAAARLFRQNGLMADAEEELKAALEIDGEHAEVQLDLASLYVATDRAAEAEKIVTALLEVEPFQRRARLLKGVVLYHSNRLDEAEEVLKTTLLLNPDPVQTHYYLGLVYEKKGDPEKAAEHYREALVRVIEERPL